MLTSLLDGRVMAERHGRGQPSVVALHGWGRTSADWNSVLRSEDALALDLPGHGNTPVPESVWGSDEYAARVVEAIASQVSTPFTLVGHSFGGRVAVRIAAAHPELISTLVLTGAPLYRRSAPAKPPATFRLVKRLNTAGIVSDAVLDRMRNKYGSPDYRATSGIMRSVFVKLVNEDYEESITKIAQARVAVALVWGERDTEAPVSVAERINAAIPGSVLRVVPGSGHLLDAALSGELRSAIAESTASQARN